MKRSVGLWINGALIDRLDEVRHREGRSQISMIEQALAEHLNVPIANRELPEQPVELCARCERGVLNEGRCAECNWRRVDPREMRARGTTGERSAKHSKGAKVSP